MRERAKAMLRIDAVLRTLPEVDQRTIALEVYLAYFPQVGVHKLSPNGVVGVHKESTKQGANPQVSQELDLRESSQSSANRQLSDDSKEILSFLNVRTGRSYRAVETNLVLIRSCLKSGATLDDCRGVIARKVREWKGTEYEKYLRPVTLFNKTKFEQYIGEQPHA